MRIVDKELYEFVKSLPCVACGVDPGGQAHHVKTRGSGGGDTADNLMPLCFEHHRQWHDNPRKMIRRYSGVFYWLEGADRWEVLRRYGIYDLADLELGCLIRETPSPW